MQFRNSLIALALLALTGCSLLSTGSGTSGTGGGVAVPPKGGVVDPAPFPGGGDGALRVAPDPTIVEARPSAIDHVVIGPDGRTITVYYWGGNQACFGLSGILVDVGDGVPMLIVLEGTRPAAVGMACTMEALLKSAVVVLAAPILVDGSGAQHPQAEGPRWGDVLGVEPIVGVIEPRAVSVAGYHLASDGVSLTVYHTGGTEECYATAQPGIEVAGGVVRITVLEGGRPGGANVCDDIGVAKALSITLDTPLLLDGSSLPLPPAS